MLSAATGIAPQHLLDPTLPPGFLELMFEHVREIEEYRRAL
jgi:hypothetical protein